MHRISPKHIFHGHMVVTLFLIISSIYVFGSNTGIAKASINDSSGVTVGVTYYGGEYDGNRGGWIIENTNQCNRIHNNEFTAASLGAVLGDDCTDDNGLGWINDLPLHNTVSYAELSNNPNSLDGAALGGLPNGAHLEINYHGRCVVAEKRDNGTGGGPVNGYKRSLDLWWQTAKAIGFTNGWDTMSVRSVSSSTPLSPLGGTSSCGSSAPSAVPVGSPSAKPSTTKKSTSTKKASVPAASPTTKPPDTPPSPSTESKEISTQQGVNTGNNAGGKQQPNAIDLNYTNHETTKGISYSFIMHHNVTLKSVLFSLLLPVAAIIMVSQSSAKEILFGRLFSRR